MKLVYPACFYEDKIGYSVIIPDLQGCQTEGNNLEKAIEMAEEAIAGWILGEIDRNKNIPEPSHINKIKLDMEEYGDGFKTLISVDISSYAQKWSSKAVKKTLSIPEWINTKAEGLNLNFSKILQEALLQKISFKK